MSKNIPIEGAEEFHMRYREVLVAVLEVVPPRDQLPDCRAQKSTGFLCDYKARYLRDGRPVCGVHLFSRTDIFLED